MTVDLSTLEVDDLITLSDGTSWKVFNIELNENYEYIVDAECNEDGYTHIHSHVFDEYGISSLVYNSDLLQIKKRG
jgi:hypothetical protein